MREINTEPLSIILEPIGRNTAPAITIAAIKALEYFHDPILLILSSDHEIKDPSNFRKAVEFGLNDAENEKLVTFQYIDNDEQSEIYSKVDQAIIFNKNGFKV